MDILSTCLVVTVLLCSPQVARSNPPHRSLQVPGVQYGGRGCRHGAEIMGGPYAGQPSCPPWVDEEGRCRMGDEILTRQQCLGLISLEAYLALPRERPAALLLEPYRPQEIQGLPPAPYQPSGPPGYGHNSQGNPLGPASNSNTHGNPTGPVSNSNMHGNPTGSRGNGNANENSAGSTDHGGMHGNPPGWTGTGSPPGGWPKSQPPSPPGVQYGPPGTNTGQPGGESVLPPGVRNMHWALSPSRRFPRFQAPMADTLRKRTNGGERYRWRLLSKNKLRRRTRLNRRHSRSRMAGLHEKLLAPPIFH